MANDTVNVQRGIVGAGADDDTYVLSANLIDADAQITISDVEGSNSIQLIGGLTISSSIVAGDTAQLTLSNGAVVTVLGASTMSYVVGGNPLTGTAGVTKDYSTFVADVLGTTVPADGEANSTGGESTVNEDGTATGGDPNAPTYALTAGATSVDEGATATFSLATTNVTEGTEVAYTISGVDAADVDGGSLTGTATVAADGTATISVALLADAATEGAETLTVAIDGTTTSASTTVNDSSTAPVAGETFSLTTGFDSLTGTANDDTFVGLLSGALATGSTAQPGDNIVGGDGNDTLNIYVSGDAGGAFTMSGLTVSGVENFTISNFDTDGNDTTVDVSSFQGLETIGTIGSGTNGDTIFANMSSVIAAQAKGAGDVTLSYASSAVSGTSDTQTVTVDDFTGAFTVSEVESVTINTSNNKSTISTLTTDGGTQDATTLTLTGDQALTITADLETNNGALTSIDGSAATGNLTFETDDTGTTSIKLGAGDDKLTRNQAAATETVDAGAGTDTLVVSTGANVTSAKLANFTNFETLEVTDGGTNTISLDGISMFTKLINSDGTNSETTTFSNVAANTALAVTAADNNDEATTLSLKSDTNADSINVTIGAASGTTSVDMGALTLNNHETINIESVSAANKIAALTSTDATKLVVTGSQNLTVTAFTGSTNLETIDASAMTGQFIMGAALTSTDAATITTGSGNDTIVANTGNTTVTSNAGNDHITLSTGTNTVDAGDGVDTVVLSSGKDNVTLGAGDDIVQFATFSHIDANDTINGGDGTDSIQFTAAADADFTSSTTQLSNVSNVEKFTFSGLDGTDTVTINDTVMTDSAVTLEFTSTVTGANTVNATAALSSNNTVNFTDNSGQATTYQLANAKDNVDLGAGDDTVTVGTIAYLSANDTLAGGTGTDTLNFAEQVGSATTISESVLANVTGFEVFSFDTNGTAAGTGNYSLTLTDTIVGNQVNGGETLTVSRGDQFTTPDTGTLTVDGSAVTSSYKLTLKGADGVDTLTGGAGDDIILGGTGSDVIKLSAGGADKVEYTESDEGTDQITGFTLRGTSSTAATGTDQIVLSVDPDGDGSDAADVFDGGALDFAATDPTTNAGTYATIDSTDYNEIVGVESANSGIEANHVNVITTRGYSSLDAALKANGVNDNGTTDVTGAGVVVFYNTSTLAAEVHYVSVFDGADGDDGALTTTSTQLASLTDVTLTGMTSFGYENFAVISEG